jgi:hypothetical protein
MMMGIIKRRQMDIIFKSSNSYRKRRSRRRRRIEAYSVRIISLVSKKIFIGERESKKMKMS